MARSLEERLRDIRQAAIDLRDFITDMETAAFHALPHADRMGFRAIKNALTELGEAAKAIPEETRPLLNARKFPAPGEAATRIAAGRKTSH